MATYKVIQDIEAEDKILGPLTLRQFIFAIIAIFLFYICFILVGNGVWPLLLVFLPPALFFGFFALPFGRDQPTEIWALAKLRYYFKPRQRVWNQSGIKELVTITVPKKVELVLTNGLSQTEVKSRLQALANTIDSRGWAIKNISSYSPTPMGSVSSERLLDIATIPMDVPDGDIVASDDMLDATTNPIAQQFNNMIDQSSQDHRQRLVDELNGVPKAPAPVPTNQNQPAEPPADYWFMNSSRMSGSEMPAPPAPLPVADSPDEAILTAALHAKSTGHPSPYGNMRTVQPAGGQPQAQAASPVVTPPSDPAILSLANNDDLNVSTLAREAKKAKGEDQDEVVIPLH